MKSSIAISVAVVLTAAPLWSLTAHAQHEHGTHDIEEIIVSASQNKTRAETALPINVLTGEELLQNASATLGETIRNTIGVHSSSFGAGVGQPVIRGLSGNRVDVMQNNLSTLDASGASQDHASSVEALLAERVEIIRGPATLLYGNGAIGGVVNVIDGRIPETVPAETEGGIEVRASSVDSGSAAVAKFDGGSGNFAWHLDGLYRDTDDYDIPGWAIDEAAVEALAHHEEEGQEPVELENTEGFVANSSTRARNLTAGASWVGDNGFFGMAVSRLKNEYGLPPGSHGAHHETEGAAGVEEAHAEEHEEFVRLRMNQTRVDARGGLSLDGFVERLNVQLTSNRYEHEEMEGSEVGTVFDNDGVEGRFTLNHGGPEGLSGVVGVQVSDRDFSATGEEAFIPQSAIRSAGLFALESLDRGSFTYELGARINQQSIDTRGQCENRESTWSASAASIWNYREDANLSAAISRSERAPTVEELYSNVDNDRCVVQADPEARVVHAATARFELGNPNLHTETGNNIELAWHKHLGEVRAEVNLFYNRFDDFIYLADVGEFEETVVSRYLQEDATFKGVEAQVLFPLAIGTRHLDLTLFTDYVDAELSTGDKLPRIPPARAGFEFAYAMQDWSARLRTTFVDDQDEVAAEELETDGYLRVDAYLDYHLPLHNQELLIFAKGLNLGNEEIRDHTSFLKHYAPEPGRSFEVGMRYRF